MAYLKITVLTGAFYAISTQWCQVIIIHFYARITRVYGFADVLQGDRAGYAGN